MNNKLIFFNKDGYPYNFKKNDREDYLEGKVYFDHNSSDTFKTLALYVFEEVDEININDGLELDSFSLYSDSGISFVNGDSLIRDIENIEVVNRDQTFYSKWIFGKDFHQYYPIGSIVELKNIKYKNSSGTIDTRYQYFTSDFYTILDNKTDAVLVVTSLKNSERQWTNTYVSGGTIQSCNQILLPETGGVSNYINNSGIYESKKLSIIASDFNTGVCSYTNSGNTQQFYSEYDLSLMSGNMIDINISLFTERPKIYEGNCTFVMSGSSAKITFEKEFSSFFNVGEGNEIIFYQKNNTKLNSTIFTVIDGGGEYDIYNGDVMFEKVASSNSVAISSFNNTQKIEYTNNIYIYSDIQQEIIKGDIIQLSGSTESKNHNRNLTVEKYQNFRDLRLSYWRNVITNDTEWYKNVKSKALNNGRTLEQEMGLECLYAYSNNDNNKNSPNYIPSEDRFNTISVKEYVIEETNITNYNIKKIIKKSDTLICSVSSPYMTEYTTYTGYVIGYSASNVLKFKQDIIKIDGINNDYPSTITAFNYRYSSILDKYGIYVYYDNDKLKISSIYQGKYFSPTIKIGETSITNDNFINIINLKTSSSFVNEYTKLSEKSKFISYYSSIIKIDLKNNNTGIGFTLFANDSEYYINFNTDTQVTLSDFVNKYYQTFYLNGFILSSDIERLYIDGIYPDSYIYSLSLKVNSFSSYLIEKEELGKGIIISSNSLKSQQSFFEIGLSSGMILNILGSKFPVNNKQYNILGFNADGTEMELSYQGIFISDNTNEISVSTSPYIRKPRLSYERDIKFSFKFNDTDIDETYKNMFFYDFSGEQLKPYNGDKRLAYTGVKPLWSIEDECSGNNTVLNDEPNKMLEYVNDPHKQQTVFRGTDGKYAIEFLLDRLDSESDLSILPEPMQIFLGYNDKEEGVSYSDISMDMVVDISFSGYTDSSDNRTGIKFSLTGDGKFIMISDKPYSFIDMGFEIGQYLDIKFESTDYMERNNFENSGPYHISEVTMNTIKIDTDIVLTGIIPFDSTLSENSYKFSFTVLPQALLRLQVYGSTEIEDERYRVLLNNLGIRIDEDVEHIFSQSDINEDGYDYILLNEKRKEMLNVFPEIYNYIGSYKAIINSINYFGWNELQLNEYYKNIDKNSPLFNKLVKVTIPDIFDNTVPGWNSQDSLGSFADTKEYIKTNLFNLTYNITDENGNNITLYSLNEVQIKLNKLKKWLRRNVMPLSTNLVDITGKVSVSETKYQWHDTSNVIIKALSSTETVAVNFNITSTLNFGTNYMVELSFYVLGNIIPKGWTGKIKTFMRDSECKLVPQKYFKIHKDNLDKFSFTIDKMVDHYIYVETCYYNERGAGIIYNKMTDTTLFKNFLLINNNFKVPSDYKYLNTEDGYYYFDKDGYYYISDEKISLESYTASCENVSYYEKGEFNTNDFTKENFTKSK